MRTFATSARPPLSAKNADKFSLYEQSVQNTEAEIEFLDRLFRRERKRPARTLREDFCGTALLCADWVASDAEHRAFGVDLDADTLAYGKKKHVDVLGEAARRVRLLRANVLTAEVPPVDLTVAFNFSYCVFKERATLVQYFARVRDGLEKDGAFVLDIYGGPDAQTELIERKRVKGFTYVWEQEPLDALSGFAMRHISFEFKDGSALKRAFSYDWRIWSLPELRDCLREAGYTEVDVYWEGSDGKGGGNGVFKKVRQAENEQSYIAYIVAWR